MKTQTKELQAVITPKLSLKYLKDGNIRFQNNLRANRNLIEQVKDTSKGQFPFATILSCIDSRVSPELIFDQGLGDIFSVRIAGNFINTDILGSMEFACKLAKTKLIVVLGHTACGAIKGACDDVKLGNLTDLLTKIKPAVEAVIEPKNINLRNSSNLEFVNNVAVKNIQHTISQIIEKSDVLAEMQSNGDIEIIGAMYDVNTGKVNFKK